MSGAWIHFSEPQTPGPSKHADCACAVLSAPIAATTAGLPSQSEHFRLLCFVAPTAGHHTETRFSFTIWPRRRYSVGALGCGFDFVKPSSFHLPSFVVRLHGVRPRMAQYNAGVMEGLSGRLYRVATSSRGLSSFCAPIQLI